LGDAKLRFVNAQFGDAYSLITGSTEPYAPLLIAAGGTTAERWAFKRTPE
jgi:hypothetical protein